MFNKAWLTRLWLCPYRVQFPYLRSNAAQNLNPENHPPVIQRVRPPSHSKLKWVSTGLIGFKSITKRPGHRSTLKRVAKTIPDAKTPFPSLKTLISQKQGQAPRSVASKRRGALQSTPVPRVDHAWAPRRGLGPAAPGRRTGQSQFRFSANFLRFSNIIYHLLTQIFNKRTTQ